MGFLNPLEEVHLLASPKPTVYNQVNFHDTVESAEYALRPCCLAEPDVGGRVARFINLYTDCFAIICLSLKYRAVFNERKEEAYVLQFLLSIHFCCKL